MSAIVTLRAVPTEADTDVLKSIVSRDVRRAYISPATLRTHKVAAGDWVLFRSGSAFIMAQAWPRTGVDDNVVALSLAQTNNLCGSEVDMYRFKAGQSQGRLVSVVLKEVPLTEAPSSSKLNNGARPPIDLNSPRERVWCKAAIKEALTSLHYVRTGYSLIIGDTEKAPRKFEITSVEVSSKDIEKRLTSIEDGMEELAIGEENPRLYEMHWRTSVSLEGEKLQETKEVHTDTPSGRKTLNKKGSPNMSTSSVPHYINLFTPTESPVSAYTFLGGLQSQIDQIKTLLDLPMLYPDLYIRFGLNPPRGILLHGPPGTGKTALARAVASSAGCSCIVVNGPELSSAYHGETEERLRGVFTEARKRSPCIVVLDEVDALCPRRDGGEGGEVERRVVATLLTLMDGVPDVKGRREILDIMLSKIPHSLSEEDLSSLAARTHGYVGADLFSLVRESASAAISRFHLSSSPSHSEPVLTNVDILSTLPSIRPSAMREVFVETPTVRWSDIGGQQDVKQKLKECIEWPLMHKDTFKRLGVEAPRGVLLYGPPGCSKTMTAKALATESGINFIAVKGPELLNKYVGESERAVREIFRKARAASPSIIFFDEIDALGSARSDDHTHSGVLTSLLNEMDGVEELSGVTVVAATNRPDVLDSALMRPGRLDRILYVGAPDFETRKDIFRIRMATMAVEAGVNVEQLAEITEGCSGAEIVSVCQDAALAAMNESLDAPYVKGSHLVNSAHTVRRRITPDMIAFFEEWRDLSGVRSA
ncbi:AAA family ATPase [Cryptococcus deuterogattii 99/473]|uniref:Unplaced genomic scaffold supercont1.4, whole genome shotgun sequence n=1 Tax=Cryptococcus deuterogattii Ram5 TaxID=1296110 RepID=A0A0D0V377_9TREE|nr:AAA family ATPase [Cryptococcus deuterogattii LA55]KIR33380.1 AAA family ATPase [Cryptococcus deuterogattii MMRL2647]KIR41876.1 AAA family ATPase [Cryptococcus deuterogattii Ram5]KIR73299.1 AAA family ATPase [Cryptococcus deuterogattii CA1014]KIR91633.1 AAA family ATPase [Cryptococcus deuterogattii CBS 10090]KIR99055.1 AAA family ATPase [Cryptococcus deuterogattii 2001/935-1]KIY60010.1 AAA family ATPase [Cryptococcus deuterogattii 99/473]